ncbi:MAG: adenylyltransferase/cytidyltransferase family protein [Anaerolineales bacterium]|jgi:cytidyltransferase-like protein
MRKVFVTGGFDDLRSRQVRFLEEASRYGELHALVWTDEAINELYGKSPKFPLAERIYLLQAIRYISNVTVWKSAVKRDTIPYPKGDKPDVWAVDQAEDNDQKKLFCASFGIDYQVIKDAESQRWPVKRFDALEEPSGRKKVIVTGCFDWFHSGHVRFFEEVSQLGDLYVAVGHDQNIKLLKGAGHPMFSQDERLYMVQSVRYVKQALITSGHGWMDAEPEIELLKPDIYAVNEDGDVPEKRAFCAKHGMQYVVLQRTPKEGLPQRESKRLRGF